MDHIWEVNVFLILGEALLSFLILQWGAGWISSAAEPDASVFDDHRYFQTFFFCQSWLVCEEVQFLKGWPRRPRPPSTKPKGLALAKLIQSGQLIAFVGPTETLNIEQPFYLMRQNFTAASIKLCLPSVLWQQRVNFLKVSSIPLPSSTRTFKTSQAQAFSLYVTWGKCWKTRMTGKK